MSVITTLVLVAALGPAAVAAQTFKPSANPVSDTVRDLAARAAKNLVASAELMPADKYGYHPTEGQMTFGQLIAHIVQTNMALCSAISGGQPPMTPDDMKKLAGTDPKEALVATVKQSFDFCVD